MADLPVVLRFSVEHRKRSSRTAAACREGDVGLAGSSPAWLAPASHEV